MTNWADVQIWNLKSRKLIRTLRGHDNYVFGVAFSPDGKVLASGSKDRTVKLWAVGTGRLIHTLRGSNGYVMGVVFSPDGKYLASAQIARKNSYETLSHNAVVLWRLPGRQRVNLWHGDVGQQAVAFSPDGHALAAGGEDGTVRIWRTWRP